MKIDIRNVPVVWINVDSQEKENEEMKNMVDSLGFKTYERFSAITDIDPHEGVRQGEEHYRCVAESHFHILEKCIKEKNFPVIILEDDIDAEDGFQPLLDNIPDDADAIYLGISHGDNNYEAIDVQNGFCKIQRVYAAHAILYLNEKYAKSVIDIGRDYIYNKNTPFDVGVAYEVQGKYNIYAPHKPIFYQADRKNNRNKWEGITRTPLNIKQKFSLFTIK